MTVLSQFIGFPVNTSSAITFNNGGAGVVSGTTYNGSTGRTISYNTLGAAAADGSNATGTWPISISGGAANATNINISATTSTDTTTYVVLVGNLSTGNQSPFIDSGLAYDASTNALTATTFIGNLQGTASSAVASSVAVTTSAAPSAFKVPFANTATSVTGSYALLQDSTDTFTYNPSSNVLVVDTLSATSSITSAGNITAYSSDGRLKENLQHIESPLDKIQSLNGYTFDWNGKAEQFGFVPKHRQKDIGLIAQEVERVLPQAIAPAPFDHELENGEWVSKSGENYLTIQYERLVPLLVEAIKEQQMQINQLKAKFEEMN